MGRALGAQGEPGCLPALGRGCDGPGRGQHRYPGQQTTIEGARRGWQSLEFVPENLNGEGYLDPGPYTLILKMEGAEPVRKEWAILEEE